MQINKKITAEDFGNIYVITLTLHHIIHDQKLPSNLIGEPSTALADLKRLVNLGSSIGCETETTHEVSAWPTSLMPKVIIIIID